jgi:hypothetical protein
MGPDNGMSHDAQFQMLLHLFQEFANSCLLHATSSAIAEPYLCLFLTDSHKNNTLHLRKGKAFPFQQ